MTSDRCAARIPLVTGNRSRPRPLLVSAEATCPISSTRKDENLGRDVASLGNARVLEIGCGDGRLVFRYAEPAALVVGIEPAIEPLATAARACPPALRGRVAFAKADAAELPFRREAFDVALFGWSL